MIDFTPYMQSTWSWTILFVMALFVGMSKTGVQGLTILTVPLLAMTFGAKPSTGLMPHSQERSRQGEVAGVL